MTVRRGQPMCKRMVVGAATSRIIQQLLNNIEGRHCGLLAVLSRFNGSEMNCIWPQEMKKKRCSSCR